MYDKVSKEITLQDGSKANIVVPQVIQVANSGYQYQYNGKEWQDELGYNMYDMDMRQYDPAIARWIVQDPVVHHGMSPYNAFDDNPVFWVDPSGTDVDKDIYGRNRYDENGNYIPPYERSYQNPDTESDPEFIKLETFKTLVRLKSTLEFIPSVDDFGNDINTGKQIITTTIETIYWIKETYDDGQTVESIYVVTNEFASVIAASGDSVSSTHTYSYTKGKEYFNQNHTFVPPTTVNVTFKDIFSDVHKNITNFFINEYNKYEVAYAVQSKNKSNTVNGVYVGSFASGFASYITGSNVIGIFTSIAFGKMNNYYYENMKPRNMILNININNFSN